MCIMIFFALFLDLVSVVKLAGFIFQFVEELVGSELLLSRQIWIEVVLV